MRKSLLLIMAVLVAIVLVVASCSAKTTTQTSTQTSTQTTTMPVKFVNVGCSFAITGPAAGWGLPIQRGLQVWADDFNARGGIVADGVNYFVNGKMYDDLGLTAAGETEAMEKAIIDDKCVALALSATKAIADVSTRYCAENKVLGLYWAGSQSFGTDKKYSIGAQSFWPEAQLMKVYYLSKTYNLTRVACIDADANHVQQDQTFAEIGARAAGATVVYKGVYPPTTMEYSGVLSKVMETNPDLIHLGASSVASIPAIMATLKDLGYTGKVSAWAIDVPSILAKVDAAYVEPRLFVGTPDLDETNSGKWAYGLYTEYLKRWPGEYTGDAGDTWNCFQIWEAGVKAAKSIDSTKVRDALVSMNAVPSMYNYGDLKWYGKEVWGWDSALGTPVAIGQVSGTKTKIVAQPSYYDFYKANTNLIIEVLTANGLMNK